MALSSFAQDIRRSIASVSSTDPAHMGVWIQEEKDVIKALESLTKETQEANKYFVGWGKKSAADVADVSEKLWTLLEKSVQVQEDYKNSLAEYRSVLKQMKAAEENLHKLKTTEKNLNEKLKDSIKKQKPTDYLKGELESATRAHLEADAAYFGQKRELLASALERKFEALYEYSTKNAIIAKHCLELCRMIPMTKLQPGQTPPEYSNSSETNKVMSQALVSLRDWNDQKVNFKTPVHNLESSSEDFYKPPAEFGSYGSFEQSFPQPDHQSFYSDSSTKARLDALKFADD